MNDKASPLSARARRRRLSSTALIGVLAALAVCVGIGATIHATLSRGHADYELRNALAVMSDLETLLTLHMAANTDFLKGVGTAGYNSQAWPIARAAVVANTYDRLEHELSGAPKAIAMVSQLRQLSAAWPGQLDAAARNVALSNAGTAFDPHQLQQANETLNSLMTILTTLRRQARDQIAQMQFKAQAQVVRQQITLAVLAVAGVLLVLLALLMRHRVALARSASRIVAAEAERRFREYFENHPVAMLIFDVSSYRILMANTAAQRLYGATLEQLRATTADRLRPAVDAEAFRRDLRRYINSGERGGSGGVRRHMRVDGTLIYVDIAYHLLDYAGHDACFTTAHDVTAHELAREHLRLRSRALQASSSAVIISQRIDGRDVITYANAACERLTGRAIGTAIGAEHWAVLGCDMSTPQARSVRAAMQANREGSALVRNRRLDGSTYWSQIRVAPVLDEQGHPTHCVTLFSDDTRYVRHQQELRRQAHEDPLTHLPNRLGLTARLQSIFATAADTDAGLAIAFIDLDNFKEVNDSLGHNAGDTVLCEVARRLSRQVCGREVIARYAGDEFVAVLAGRGSLANFVAAAAALKDCLAGEIVIGDVKVVPQACVGLALFPEHAHDPATLLRHADSAMYRAKALGPNSLQVFDQYIATENEERASLTQGLRRALVNGELSVAYQPRVSLATARTNGFEALLRWTDPERGAVSPALFIPLAERNGLILQLGEWVFEQVCLQTKAWARQCPGVVVSVNVSPVQFERSDLPAMVSAVLQRSGVSARNIELEITEGVLMAPRSLAALRTLRGMGLSIAIDDFGSGYSSLGYVRSFMADRLKLDRSFVKGIGHSRVDEVIVKTVLAMGRTLGMRVVAEGVETSRQLAYLAENGCDEIQGYYFAAPMDASDAGRHLDVTIARACERDPEAVTESPHRPV
jgi:diguanylate cyclase (GGDEF)-like protein/PAS domain S-box-containing protein